MKQLISTICALCIFVITFSLSSCSKSDLSKPAPSQQSLNSQGVENMVSAMPADIAGRYKVTRFIEDGKNETSRFTGYRFAFQANNDFVGRTNSGQTVTGKWKLDATGTRITIDISGTGSLDKLVGGWRITEVTGSLLSLVNADGDRVVFTRLDN